MMKHFPPIVLVVALLLILVPVTGCSASGADVSKVTGASINLSGVFMGEHFAIIPIGNTTDPQVWVEVVDQFEREKGVTVNSCNYTQSTIYRTVGGKNTTSALLVTFVKGPNADLPKP